jgi:O-antigen ligase
MIIKQNNVDKCAKFFAILSGFFMPISTAGTNLSILICLICVIIGGNHTQNYQILKKNQVIVTLSIGLFLLLSIGTLYSTAPFAESLKVLGKYRELLFIPLFIIIFNANKKMIKWGIYAYLLAMLLTLILSYLIAGGWEIKSKLTNDTAVFKHYITQGWLMAFAVFLLLTELINKNKIRNWGVFIFSILATFNILFMAKGRTGYVILFSLILLWLYQRFKLKGLVIGTFIIIILGGSAYLGSDILRDRVDVLISSSQDYYKNGEIKDSVGIRLDFYKNGFTILKNNLIFGSGTGSIKHEYENIAKHNTILTTNIHNEFLMIAIQLGLLGFILFTALLIGMWNLSNSLGKYKQHAQALVIIMFIGSLLNSLLLDFTEGHIFAYFTGMFFAKT